MVTFHPFPPYFTIFPCHWGWILTLGTHRIPFFSETHRVPLAFRNPWRIRAMRNARDLEKSLQNEQKKLQDEQKKLAELQSHKGDGTAEEVEPPAAAEAQKGLSLGFLWG